MNRDRYVTLFQQIAGADSQTDLDAVERLVAAEPADTDRAALYRTIGQMREAVRALARG